MKNFKTAMMALGLTGIFGLGACGGNKMEEMVDEICACKDLECVGKVTEKFEKNKDDIEKAAKDDPEKAAKLMKKMQDCTTKMAGGGE